MSTNIVPFGKYKGQPVEVLAQDKEYCDWLAGQDWFRTRFTAIHTLIVNNFGAPAETPDHNALQANFTDKEFAKRFAFAVSGDLIRRAFTSNVDKWLQCIHARATSVRNEIASKESSVKHYKERIATGEAAGPFLNKEFYERQIASAESGIAGGRKQLEQLELESTLARSIVLEKCARAAEFDFEHKGADVVFCVTFDEVGCDEDDDHRYRDVFFSVECKPSLGDDYPAVLRQMKADETKILLIGDGGYTGIGATLAQVRSIFATASIRIVLLSEVGT